MSAIAKRKSIRSKEGTLLWARLFKLFQAWADFFARVSERLKKHDVK